MQPHCMFAIHQVCMIGDDFAVLILNLLFVKLGNKLQLKVFPIGRSEALGMFG